MYGLRALMVAAYFTWAGYMLHKKQVPQKIAAVLNSALDDMNRRSAVAFFDEAARRPAIPLTGISGDSGH